MEFTRRQTDIGKGVAICLMFVHHLYGFGDRLLNGNSYIPLIPFLSLEDYVARLGNICIAMFLFLSGYGMFLGYLRSQKPVFTYSLLKVKDFYFTYWLYFLVFVPIGFIFFKDATLWGSTDLRYTADPILFLKNFLGWRSTYNGEWWFVRMFLTIIIFLFPLYIKLSESKSSGDQSKAWNAAPICFVSLFLFCLSYAVHPFGAFNFLLWQTSFASGIVCAQLMFFSSRFVSALDPQGWIWVIFGLLLCSILRFKTGVASNDASIEYYDFFYDFLIVPFFIYFSVRLVTMLRCSALFSYLGKYSFQLWLIHSFFCYYYIQTFIYSPKWSPLIFLLLTVVSLLSVVVLEHLRDFLRLKQLEAICMQQLKNIWLRFRPISN
jgi:hypothetical protein